ncbi:hypothetical protein FACS1894199_09780 [Bacteroidia bacterium]|nr:hypothetical protein FACS1894199_09780 [Bacteroidia bacterium]
MEMEMTLKMFLRIVVSMRIVLLLPAISILLLLNSSCNDDSPNQDETKKTQTDAKYVNKWIYENMSLYYYWNTKLPRKPDYTLSPADFFESIKYPYNETTHDGDRFSWIQESYTDLLNSLSGVSSSEVGFEFYTGARPGSGDNSVIGYIIVYVKKGTDAATKLKRGDYITAVNGTKVTEANYTSLLNGSKSSYTLTVTDAETGLSSPVTITTVPTYAEHPILTSKIFDPKNGKTIGYLVYNFFASDNGDNTYKYDIELANLLETFKTGGVTDLVLDLRYNGGGAIQSAIYLASALVDRDVTDKTFAYNEYNTGYTEALIKYYGNSDALSYQLEDKVKNNSISDLGKQLNSIYILTGRYTASASELIINGLKPYIGDKLKLIGRTTYGKNVGSITFYEKNDSRNKWGMQPIVLKISNKDHFSDYGGGFTPETLLNEFTLPFQPLGSEQEPLLAKAIEQITGIVAPLPASASKNVGHEPRIIGSSFDQKKGAYQMFVDEEKFILQQK